MSRTLMAMAILLIAIIVISPVSAENKYYQDDGTFSNTTPQIHYNLTSGDHTWVSNLVLVGFCVNAWGESNINQYNYARSGANSELPYQGDDYHYTSFAQGNSITILAADNQSYALATCQGGKQVYSQVYMRSEIEPFTPTITATPAAPYVAPQTISLNGSVAGKLPDTHRWDIGYYAQAGYIYSSIGYQNISYDFVNPATYVINYTVTNGSATAIATSTITVSASTASMIKQWVETVDSNGNFLVGSNINILHVENGTWWNYTNTPDGMGYAYAPEYSTVDIYGSLTGYVNAARMALPVSVSPYTLTLYPVGSVCTIPGTCGGSSDPGAGNVNLIVNVLEETNNDPIAGVMLTATTPAGASVSKTTSTGGSASFFAPNLSVISVAASKSGYISRTQTITTTAFGPDTMIIELSKNIITPTPTYPNGSVVTTMPTVTPSTTAGKDTAMMDQLRDAGPSLIGLCIVAIMFGILKMIMKF